MDRVKDRLSENVPSQQAHFRGEDLGEKAHLSNQVIYKVLEGV